MFVVEKTKAFNDMLNRPQNSFLKVVSAYKRSFLGDSLVFLFVPFFSRQIAILFQFFPDQPPAQINYRENCPRKLQNIVKEKKCFVIKSLQNGLVMVVCFLKVFDKIMMVHGYIYTVCDIF